MTVVWPLWKRGLLVFDVEGLHSLLSLWQHFSLPCRPSTIPCAMLARAKRELLGVERFQKFLTPRKPVDVGVCTVFYLFIISLCWASCLQGLPRALCKLRCCWRDFVARRSDRQHILALITRGEPQTRLIFYAFISLIDTKTWKGVNADTLPNIKTLYAM